ncbi:MAG: Hemin uptake protein hemP [Pseudomonadota bacterium]|uniref:Hemin uptake protein HemP n=1 Tax=Pseudaquabacterium rugosum TaxID=2984194 RepID=A0ABU9BB42_9BURK
MTLLSTAATQAAPIAEALLPLGLSEVSTEALQRPLRVLSSRQLMGRDQEIHIAHGAAMYRLRITALGKLILTK